MVRSIFAAALLLNVTAWLGAAEPNDAPSSKKDNQPAAQQSTAKQSDTQQADTQQPATEQSSNAPGTSSPLPVTPNSGQSFVPPNGRYTWVEGRIWYQTPDGRWFVQEEEGWVPSEDGAFGDASTLHDDRDELQTPLTEGSSVSLEGNDDTVIVEESAEVETDEPIRKYQESKEQSNK